MTQVAVLDCKEFESFTQQICWLNYSFRSKTLLLCFLEAEWLHPKMHTFLLYRPYVAPPLFQHCTRYLLYVFTQHDCKVVWIFEWTTRFKIFPIFWHLLTSSSNITMHMTTFVKSTSTANCSSTVILILKTLKIKILKMAAHLFLWYKF